MKFLVTIHGQEHTLELSTQNSGTCLLDGVPLEAEVAEVRPGVYSLLLGGKSFEVRVAPGAENSVTGNNAGHYDVQINGTSYAVSLRDLRRRSRSGTGLALEGKQNIKAPMAGKVIRVLVAENQLVEAGQGLIVVEAMKMQNEIKCPKAGGVQKVLAREGQAVNAGETLLIVE
ncbi:MAG: biotin/lipoyl-binding protein [Acidobacteria bacterium]|nr:biotin/lipoyl-binding protein [Acidobacteriota bacterium]